MTQVSCRRLANAIPQIIEQLILLIDNTLCNNLAANMLGADHHGF